VAQLADDDIWRLIQAAIQERRFDSYVHWEEAAQAELAKDSELTPEGVIEELAIIVGKGERPKVEIQKGGPYDGQERWVWRPEIDGTELYIKVNVELDHLKEPCLTIVRCHRGHY
jgi:hypothetical protein